MIIYLSIYFVLSCTASRKSEPVKGKTFVVTDAKTQHGQQLFMQNCQKMSSGWRSGFRACIELESGARLYKKIPGKTWTGCNASFKSDEISKADLNDIVAYLKALRRF